MYHLLTLLAHKPFFTNVPAFWGNFSAILLLWVTGHRTDRKQHLWFVSKKRGVCSLTPCSTIQQLCSMCHTTGLVSAKVHIEGQKCMNVYVCPAVFPSTPLPLRLPACSLHVYWTVHGQLAVFPQMSLPHSFQTFPTTAVLCLPVSWCLDAVVHFVNMTAFTRGGLQSSFWIVDRKHIYIGSADMDWRSLSKVTASINNMSVQRKSEPLQSGLVRGFIFGLIKSCFWSLSNTGHSQISFSD